MYYPNWNFEWSYVVFSDEMKFNQDGPDGFKYYWNDVRREKETSLSRYRCGGSVMIWAGIIALGKKSLALLNQQWIPLCMCPFLRITFYYWLNVCIMIVICL